MSENTTPAPGLDRRGLLRGVAGVAAGATLLSHPAAAGVSVSADVLEIRRAGERLEIGWSLNANVVGDEVLYAANDAEVDEAHADFMALARRVWAKPVVGDVDVVERAEIARYLSMYPNALDELVSLDEDGIEGYGQACAHLIVAVLALMGGVNV